MSRIVIYIDNGLIIKELGISKGAFYHYFSTKEACADAVVDMYVKACLEKLSP